MPPGRTFDVTFILFKVSLNFASNLAYSTPRIVCSRQDKSILFTNITIIQRVPQQTVWYVHSYVKSIFLVGLLLVSSRYTPTVSYTLKVAWIQYLSFFILIGFLISRLNSFVFRHQVSCSI